MPPVSEMQEQDHCVDLVLSENLSHDEQITDDLRAKKNESKVTAGMRSSPTINGSHNEQSNLKVGY